MNDKEIIYNIIGRYVDNILRQIRNPLAYMMADPIKNYIYRYVEPYIDAFTTNNNFEVEEASAYLEQEAIEKINSFKRTFKESKNENVKNNF
jgi:hypothetical protein